LRGMDRSRVVPQNRDCELSFLFQMNVA